MVHRLITAFTCLLLLPVALAQPMKVYLLCVEEADSMWTEKGQFASSFKRLLSELDLNIDVEVVRSVGDWGRLVGEGVEGVILVNAHGELVPIPSEYGGDWKAFYSKLAELVREKGWVVVNVAGYGFYYIGNIEVEEVGVRRTIGDVGLTYFAGELGFTATAWPLQGASTGEVTDFGSKVFEALGLEIPDRIQVLRPIRADIMPEWWFYEVRSENLTAYACAAYKAGRGFLLWSGLSWQDADLQVKTAVAMIALLLDPELPMRPPKPKPLLTPFMLATILFVLGTIILVSAFILYTLRKIRSI